MITRCRMARSEKLIWTGINLPKTDYRWNFTTRWASSSSCARSKSSPTRPSSCSSMNVTCSRKNSNAYRSMYTFLSIKEVRNGVVKFIAYFISFRKLREGRVSLHPRACPKTMRTLTQRHVNRSILLHVCHWHQTNGEYARQHLHRDQRKSLATVKQKKAQMHRKIMNII